MKTIFYTITKDKRTDKETVVRVGTVDQWTGEYTRGLPLQFGGVWYHLLTRECVIEGVAFVVVIPAKQERQDGIEFVLRDWYRECLESRVRSLGEA